LKVIDEACAKIDDELHVLTAERKALVKSRPPIAEKVDKSLLNRYERIRKVRTPAVVPSERRSLRRLLYVGASANCKRNYGQCQDSCLSTLRPSSLF
jgi:hypothetical protein